MKWKLVIKKWTTIKSSIISAIFSFEPWLNYGDGFTSIGSTDHCWSMVNKSFRKSEPKWIDINWPSTHIADVIDSAEVVVQLLSYFQLKSLQKWMNNVKRLFNNLSTIVGKTAVLRTVNSYQLIMNSILLVKCVLLFCLVTKEKPVTYRSKMLFCYGPRGSILKNKNNKISNEN